MDLCDFDQRLQAVLRDIPPPFRAELLAILELPDEDRARAIGDLYRAGRQPVAAELLMDLESNPGVRAWVLAELRRA